MAVFLPNMPFADELNVELDYLYVESNLGGALNQYDSSGETIARFTLTFKTVSFATIVQLSLFLSGEGATEETEIEVDGITYIGVFTGIQTQQHPSTLYILQTEFKGKEQ